MLSFFTSLQSKLNAKSLDNAMLTQSSINRCSDSPVDLCLLAFLIKVEVWCGFLDCVHKDAMENFEDGVAASKHLNRKRKSGGLASKTS